MRRQLLHMLSIAVLLFSLFGAGGAYFCEGRQCGILPWACCCENKTCGEGCISAIIPGHGAGFSHGTSGCHCQMIKADGGTVTAQVQAPVVHVDLALPNPIVFYSYAPPPALKVLAHAQEFRGPPHKLLSLCPPSLRAPPVLDVPFVA